MEHVTEECPQLLAKWETNKGNVNIVMAEPRGGQDRTGTNAH